MVNQLHLKPYSSTSSSSSSSLELPYSKSYTIMCRMKTLVHAYVLRHVSHLFRALAAGKTAVPELLQRISMAKNHFAMLHQLTMIRLHHKKKKLLTTIKHLHFNWRQRPSPSVLPRAFFESFHAYGHVYYDPTWNSVICTHDHDDEAINGGEIGGDEAEPPPLSGYLNWLEGRNDDDLRGEEDAGGSEIDRLAEKFIASCHEKFRLEKQESYRRYQDMLARGI